MKSIKLFGLVVLAALMAMAFVGAGSAMAESTQLCKADPGTGSPQNCTGGAITAVHLTSVGKATLLTPTFPLLQVECNVLFESTSVGALGSPQVIEGHFTYTNCGCTVKEKTGTTAKINVLKEGHERASVTGEAEIIVNCKGIECTYKGAGLSATALGPLLAAKNEKGETINPNGEVFLSEQGPLGKGTFCPSEAKLDIKMTPLAATSIAN